jgi:hypothetical protein
MARQKVSDRTGWLQARIASISAGSVSSHHGLVKNWSDEGVWVRGGEGRLCVSYHKHIEE